jgi:hypothetical protein
VTSTIFADDIFAKWGHVEGILNSAKARLQPLAPGSDEAAVVQIEIDRLTEEWGDLWDRCRCLQRDAMVWRGATPRPPRLWAPLDVPE